MVAEGRHGRYRAGIKKGYTSSGGPSSGGCLGMAGLYCSDGLWHV